MTRKLLVVLIVVLFAVGLTLGIVFPALPLPAFRGECKMNMSTFYTSGKLCVMGKAYYDVNRLLIVPDNRCRCYVVPANVSSLFRIR